MGGANIPPELQLVATGVGVNILSNMLERVAKGEKIADDEIRRDVQRAIDESNIADALTEDQFYRAVSQLVRHMDLQSNELRGYILAGFEALATSQQADQILALQQRILELLEAQDRRPVATPCNLVPRPPHFAGRTDDIANLRVQLDNEDKVAVVAVRGLGGIGKTTLVQHFANRDDLPYKLRLWAAPGQDFREDIEANILKNWARRLAGYEFPPEAGLADIRQVVGQILSQCDCDAPTLLVIDDVWENTIPVARNLQTLVNELPELRASVLVTTRSEQVAADLDCRSATLAKMTPPEGAEMIIDLLPEAEAQRAQLESLSETLGGHPLALKLAVSRLRVNYSVSRLDSLIDSTRQGIDAGDPFADLKLESADETSKENSVSVTLKMTLDALATDDLRSKFRALGALPPDLPFRAEHVYAVWDDENADVLDSFVAEGLLIPDPAQEGWYTQHRLLRAYARSLSRQPGLLWQAIRLLFRRKRELDSATARHHAYIINFARSVFVEHQDHTEKWNDLITESDLRQIHALGDDLAARLAGTADPSEQDTRLRAMPDPGADSPLHLGGGGSARLRSDLLHTAEAFASAVSWYIHRRYVGAEGRRWLWAGLVAARARESQNRIGLFANQLAQWYRQRGYMQEALPYFEKALAMSKTLENQEFEATVLNNIGEVYRQLGEIQKALEHFEQALPLYVAVGDRGGEATTLNSIGGVWDALGEKQRALDYYERALPLRQAVGDRGGEAVMLNNIGTVYFQLGEQQQALDYFERALPLRWAVGDPYGESVTRGNIALILWEQGERDTALGHMQTARDLKARIGISTADEDQVLRVWGLMQQTGIYDEAKLAAYVQAQQGGDAEG